MNFCDPIFLLGAGGMGMASLAKYLLDKGYTIFGWDDFITDERKQQLDGIHWTSTIPENCKTVVYSSAIHSNHPLLISAKGRCNCYLRGYFLAQLLKNQKICAICGSHGKSTTTAYLIHFFKHYNIPVNYLLGAEFQNDFYANAVFDAEAQWTLLELDESDGTIEYFSSNVTVVLNTDWDHPTHYPSAKAYQSVFERLCQRTQQWVFSKQFFETKARLQIINVEGLNQNAVMAEYVFKALTSIEVGKKDLEAFPGIKRRREVLLQAQYLTVISDYAHHPEELRALLASFPKEIGLHVVFEPHRISRLNRFFQSFVSVLEKVKDLYLCPVYQAFEEHQTLLKTLEAALPQAKPLSALSCDSFLYQNIPIGLIFVGAGNIDKQARLWIQNFKQHIQRCAQREGLILDIDHSMKCHSFLGIGGTALAYSQPDDLIGLQKLLNFCASLHLENYIMGGGSNTVIPERYDGLVLQLNKHYWRSCRKISDHTFEVYAGCFLKNFLDVAEKQGVSGFEFLDGIPGTLGGALAMNAGTHDLGILDCVQRVTVMDRSGHVYQLQKHQIQYGYRSCETLKDYIIVSALLVGEVSTSEFIRNKRKRLQNQRSKMQPVGRSLGCFFKNPHSISAGKLIDELGLKGMHFGDIFVSTVHANFIINKGKGSFSDVLKMMRYIRYKVKTEKDILLEPEVRLLGKSWENVL